MTTLYQAKGPHDEFRAVQSRTVSVGGQVIPAALIAREMQLHEAASPLEAWQAAARALAVRELLLQEARRLEIVAEPIQEADGLRETDEEALIRIVVETQVTTPDPDQETCRRYYERNLVRFCSPELFEASHILLAARLDDAIARKEAHDKATALLAHLRQKPADFEALAIQHSACPSAATGGNLGQIRHGDTVPEFDQALTTLDLGEIAAEPVETRFGFHIIRLQRRILSRQLPFEMVAMRIATYLRERSKRIATAQYLSVLASQSRVEGVELPIPSDVGAMC